MVMGVLNQAFDVLVLRYGVQKRIYCNVSVAGLSREAGIPWDLALCSWPFPLPVSSLTVGLHLHVSGPEQPLMSVEVRAHTEVPAVPIHTRGTQAVGSL